MSTAFLSHADFRAHDAGAYHPERAARLDAIDAALRAAKLWDALEHPDFQPAREEQLYACHSVTLVETIHRLAERGGGQIDPDTRVAPASFEVAALAAGAAIAATDGVLRGDFDNAFVASRPPGHHAERARALGCCLFNNVAIAARHAQQKWGLERVAIVDWDVHHGNGTQEIFYRDGSIFFAGVHQWPLFPGTGRATERGADAGEGATLNFPLPAGRNDVQYAVVWREIGEAVAAFAPQLILVSAGFDAHAKDPLGGMELSAAGFAGLMRQSLEWAAQLCEGRLVAVLEGGYNLDGLSESVVAVMREMLRA
jgi:acetoin utilization deacetylase AcuC-like enzyme